MPGRRQNELPDLHDGEVTALVARRGQAERIAVHLDGRRAFDVSAVVADRAGLRAGDHLTADRQQELIHEDAPYRAQEKALRLLCLRDRSRREVETRLRQAGYDGGVVAGTVEWLAGLGYLDDRRFAAAYAAEKQRSGWGPRRIRAELVAKGVERPIVEEVLAPIEDLCTAPEDDGQGGGESCRGFRAGESRTAVEDTLLRTVRRRFGAQFAVDPVVAERRLSGFLARRGYDWETIGRLVQRMRSETAAGPEYPSIP